ncbi:splicing factor, Prp19-binding domain-containing protein [Xylariaceae sp. FL0255]|nr:splicing factor, Prp19-binding domain-containing protein [Xylariaceae sp. FL0255]
MGMTKNQVRPSRHRAGKPTGASSSSESDSDASDIEAQEDAETQQPERKIAPPPKVSSAGKIVSNLSKVDLNERRRQGQEAEDRRQAAEKAARIAAEEGFVTDDESDQDESEDGSGGDESSEEESSQDEAPRRMMLKPRFIPKSQRDANKTKDNNTDGKDEKEAERLAEEEEARRKQAMDELVEEQLRKDRAARAAGKKHWDDLVDEEEDVDTEDDVDPEAEYAAWKLRELKRIKRERDAIVAREKEQEEVDRRRNLTEDERRAEDEAYLAQQKEEKDGKGKMSYMQKYFHKGAFFQDDETAESLAKRDIMGTRFADDVKNRELLPKALQMRDMTKLGRKGASKYKDLRSEDTGRWGDFRDTRPRRVGDFDRSNVDDRYKSDQYRDRERSGPGGANAIPLGERKGVPGAPEGPRSAHRDGDRVRRRSPDRRDYRSHCDDDRDRRRDRSRSRSRSPRRYDDRRDHYSSRSKRDLSRDRDRPESDKRRRIDSR